MSKLFATFLIWLQILVSEERAKQQTKNKLMAIKNNKTILSIGCDLCEIVQHVAYKMQLITGKLMQPMQLQVVLVFLF